MEIKGERVRIRFENRTAFGEITTLRGDARERLNWSD
jgi:hypothetical protein